jgi:alpha-glucoside transport system substrate-binding protein
MSRPYRSTIIGAIALTITLAATACSGSDASTKGQSLPKQETSALAAAQAAAQKASGGKKLGGTISMLGVLSGDQLTAYLGTFAPFEQATGIKINYEATRDINAVLQTRLAGGNPPDVVSNPSAGQMRALAGKGDLVALDDIVDTNAVKQDFPSGLVNLASVDGKLYGLFFNSAVNNLVWYDPQHYQGPKPADTLDQLLSYATEQAGQGKAPFCVGLESGAASGWPGAGWIEQLVLTQSGGEAFDRWVRGELPWTSPEVRKAFETFGSIVNDPKMVAGGRTAALTTSFDKSPQGLVAKKPGCSLTVQADFLGNLLASAVPGVKPVQDIDFYQFPAGASGGPKPVITSGEMIGVLKKTPQTEAMMRYLASPAFGAMVAGTGQWISANQHTEASAYTTPLSKKAAQVYADAKLVRYTAQNSMPLELSQAFLQAVIGYVEKPASLDQQLAKLDKAQADSKP